MDVRHRARLCNPPPYCYKTPFTIENSPHRHKLEDNIKMDLREIGWVGIIWLRIWTSGGHL
jgi:hypothetical protein